MKFIAVIICLMCAACSQDLRYSTQQGEVYRSSSKFDASTEKMIHEISELKYEMTLEEVQQKMPDYVRWEYDGSGDGLGGEESHGFRWQDDVYIGFHFFTDRKHTKTKLSHCYMRKDKESVIDGELTVVKRYESPSYLLFYKKNVR